MSSKDNSDRRSFLGSAARRRCPARPGSASTLSSTSRPRFFATPTDFRAWLFTTDPKVLTSGGTQFTIRITGQFSATGFLAQTTIDQSGAGGSCHYTDEWTGTR